MLVDNAGVTKNVAKMWEEYARANGLSAAAMTQAQKVEAEYQGILRETAAQAGDLAKAQDTLMGAQAENSAQADKLATAYGGALEPAMKAVTEAGTGVLEALTAATRQMPGLASGATAAVAAMTALSTAMQGVKAVKGLIGAAGMTAATAGPLAAVAAAVGLLTAAYTAYAKKREEASAQEEAAAQAVREQEAARRAELRRLSDVNGELTALTAQYAQSQAATGALAGAYDQGNDAIGDRIALLQAEQTELLKTQEAQIQAALAEKQAALARSIETAKGVAALGAPDLSLLGEDPMGSAWYTHMIDEFCDTVTARFPEVTAQANAFRQEMMMATTFSETQAAYEGFTQAISDGIAQNADDVAALTETLAQIGEAIANPEGFSFEKTFGGVEFAQEAQEGAQGAADAFDGLGEAAQDAAKDFKTLKTQADRTARGLSNTTAMKRQGAPTGRWRRRPSGRAAAGTRWGRT